MFRYKLRTLLIVLALGPPVLAGLWLVPPWIALPLLAVAPPLVGVGLWALLYWYADQR